ncbi:MAG: hypothetical protein KKD38_09015 [Candidatus Delongbacteria bacterium]|nr:hypothetical protein [Candidatus Delongbacteria bacterium]MCG2760651.1 hypothetical protein [Candidatus Delongbacteria bacterium]
MVTISKIDFVVDSKSEEFLKRHGGATLDYTEKRFFGSGFTLKLKDVYDC